MTRRSRLRKHVARWFGPREHKTIEGQHHYDNGITVRRYYKTYRTRPRRRLVIADSWVVVEREKAA